MNEDLSVSQKLDDIAGQCRAHGNLGVAYFSKAKYQLAKENHTKQLSLAQSMQVRYTLFFRIYLVGADGGSGAANLKELMVGPYPKTWH